jgi:hypothetical protein
MGSGAMIHIRSFRKTGSCIQKLTGGFTDTDNMAISWAYLHSFKNKESRFKLVNSINNIDYDFLFITSRQGPNKNITF